MNFHPDISFNSRRSAVVTSKGMVATSQPLAVAAGIEILNKSGNAADAAIATAAALNVTEPTSTGLGGDCFALYYDAKSKMISALNGSGKSPSALSINKVREDGIEGAIPIFHPHTITVPGAAAGWCDLIEKHGKLSMSEILAPAIDLAEKGYPVAPLTSIGWSRSIDRQLSVAPNGVELTIDGRAPKAGEIFQNLGLAKTLKKLAEGGSEEFYKGEIAEAIIKVIQDEGGVMSTKDLANHKSRWEEPISTSYHGYRIWECPPNGQGLATLLALNILEGFDLTENSPLSVDRLHLQIEAMRIAFADTSYFVADPEMNPAPLNELLSKSYANERRKLINPKKAVLDQIKGSPTGSSDTVYLTVVDSEGNACSFINSNYMGFGTGFVPKGFGFTLQNRGAGFSLEEGHPNALMPSKRPYHTIIPSMITHSDNGDLFSSFGVMGGFMQPQGHMLMAINLLNDKLDPQESLDRPRFCINDGTAGGSVALEDGIPVEVMSRLAKIGHKVTPTSGFGRGIFGRGQIILRDRKTGTLWGGSDPRADGLAMSQ